MRRAGFSCAPFFIVFNTISVRAVGAVVIIVVSLSCTTYLCGTLIVFCHCPADALESGATGSILAGTAGQNGCGVICEAALDTVPTRLWNLTHYQK